MQIDLEEAIGLYVGGPFCGLKKRHYGVIAADPPWTWKAWSAKGEDRAASNHYDLMSLSDLTELPVADLAAPDCVLLLWSLNSMLPEALAVMAAWGFQYKTKAFTWVKRTPSDNGWHFGLGYHTRQNTESVLLGVRGKPKRLSGGIPELLIAPRRLHSQKPEEFFEASERLYPGPYLELFSRMRRPNWTTWGKETGSLDSRSLFVPSRVASPEDQCASSGSPSAALP